MDKRTEILILFDIYGSLLTEKQKNVMDYYYNDDLSLSEIGENSNISRQAIHDTIKRCEKLLYEYEEKLQLLKKSRVLKQIKGNVNDLLQELVSLDNQEINDIVQKICNELKQIN